MAQRIAASELGGEHGYRLGALKARDQLIERARRFYGCRVLRDSAAFGETPAKQVLADV
jgi:hypothetical protein